MTSQERNFLRKKAHNLEPMVRVGKDGINDNVIDSIKQYIEKNELMKVKLLQNSLEDATRELGTEIEKRSGAKFVGSVGKIMIFFKENKANGKLGPITREFMEFKKSKKENK